MCCISQPAHGSHMHGKDINAVYQFPTVNWSLIQSVLFIIFNDSNSLSVCMFDFRERGRERGGGREGGRGREREGERGGGGGREGEGEKE